MRVAGPMLNISGLRHRDQPAQRPGVETALHSNAQAAGQQHREFIAAGRVTALNFYRDKTPKSVWFVAQGRLPAKARHIAGECLHGQISLPAEFCLAHAR